jgi:hypothetical protein
MAVNTAAIKNAVCWILTFYQVLVLQMGGLMIDVEIVMYVNART